MMNSTNPVEGKFTHSTCWNCNRVTAELTCKKCGAVSSQQGFDERASELDKAQKRKENPRGV